MADRGQSPPADIGEVIGSYRLDALVGRGGMSCVYSASHVRLGRVAAVKVLARALAENEHFVARFFREARIVNDIRHPNIIDIIDFIEQEEPRRVAYVMEMLHGEPLSATIARHQIDVPRAIHIARQLVGALGAAHARGVVHRDLKPDNVFVVAGPTLMPVIKVLDFGIAKFHDPLDPLVSDERMIVGTPAYMAPEQITGDEVTSATDVHALGAILFELLSGTRAFPGANASTLFRDKLLGPPAELVMPEDAPDAARIKSLVIRCLSLEPRLRPTLGEVGVVLDDAAREVPGLRDVALLTGEFTARVRRDEAMLQSQASELWVELSSPSLSQPRLAVRDRRLIGAAAAAIVVMMLLIAATLVITRRELYEPEVVSMGRSAPPRASTSATAGRSGDVPTIASASTASRAPTVDSAGAALRAPTVGGAVASPTVVPVTRVAVPVLADSIEPKAPSTTRPRARRARGAAARSGAEILHKDEMPSW